VNWFYLYLKENSSQGVNYAASVSNWSGDIWVCRAYQERLATVEGHLPQWCPKPPQCITGMLPSFSLLLFLVPSFPHIYTKTNACASSAVTDYDHVSFSTLREVLAHPQVSLIPPFKQTTSKEFSIISYKN
jgi:hypothetical protein